MLVTEDGRRWGLVVRSDTSLVWECRREWDRELSVGRTHGRSGGDVEVTHLIGG